MRQAGILAAAGLYALKNHIDDLQKDHERATLFRRTIEEKGWIFPLPSPTNILIIHVKNAHSFVQTLYEKNILINAVHEEYIRVVFHRDITDAQFDYVLETFIKLS